MELITVLISIGMHLDTNSLFSHLEGALQLLFPIYIGMGVVRNYLVFGYKHDSGESVLCW